MTPPLLWLALAPATPSTPEAFSPAEQGLQPTEWLGECGLHVTPRVARLDDGVWGLEVGSTLRLWGGLAGVLQRLGAEVQTRHHGHTPARAAPDVAQGPTALAALARWRAGDRVPLWGGKISLLAHTPIALADLPLHTLGAAQPHAAVLARLGLRTWGHLRRLPRDGVARRWGGTLLSTLDQALGLHPESHRWLDLPIHFQQTLELPHSLDSAPLLLPHAHALLQSLQGWLRARQRGVLALRWQWTHDARRDGPAQGGFDLRTAQPSQAMDHWLRLTAEHLARQSLSAPVVALHLHTLAHTPWAPGSADWLQTQPANGPQPLAWTALVERLAARLGPAALTHWQPHSDHRAEHMQRLEANFYVAEKSIPSSAGGLFGSKNSSPIDRPVPSGSLWPTWLLPAPQRLALRGHRPCFQGELQLLAGPQRLELTQWPDAATPISPNATATAADPAAVRDYFVARSPGAGLLWVYRVPPGARWFLHGVFA